MALTLARKSEKAKDDGEETSWEENKCGWNSRSRERKGRRKSRTWLCSRPWAQGDARGVAGSECQSPSRAPLSSTEEEEDVELGTQSRSKER